VSSQGDVDIFNLLFQSARSRVEQWLDARMDDLPMLLDQQILEGLHTPGRKSSIQIVHEMVQENRNWSSNEDSRFSAALARKILTETLSAYTGHRLLRDDFVRRLIVNRKDELGNSMLHLAAWNSKVDMYDHLIRLGADPAAENDDGLTAFTLSVRFGRWAVFKHIWARHLTTPRRRCGSAEECVVDYSQLETNLSGLGATLSSWDLARHVETLVLQKIADEIGDAQAPRPDAAGGGDSSAEVRRKVRAWCERRLGRLVAAGVFGEPGGPRARRGGRIQQRSAHFKSATELVTLFRPAGWRAHVQERMGAEVRRKWDQGFYLVHFADTVVPFGLILLLFGLMWWQRRLSILEHRFWWAEQEVAAPAPAVGMDGACGWGAIFKSGSGRLQAALVFYGVPSLLRLAWVQSRLRPNDLDENLNWKMSRDELVNFVLANLESIFHMVAAGLFVAILSARVAAQASDDAFDCKTARLSTEKNSTAAAALVLYFNLFIVCKPYQGLGVLVQTTYRFLLKDVKHFLLMYGMLFLAFLLALQTLHSSNAHYLGWMETSTEIPPQIEKVQSLAYLANGDAPPSASTLLATETVLQGCSSKQRTISDTAFALMEISFGDGLADALEQARRCCLDVLSRQARRCSESGSDEM
jgi:hypothetical protein